METYFTTFLHVMGTFAFAISGIRLAFRKRIDWFGAYLIGLTTAIGGGTVRDILLDVTPFWMLDGKYLLATGAALLVALLFKNRISTWNHTLFLFDAIGLGLFTVVGISKSIDAGLPIWVCIAMGTITGSVGGLIRDVLLNDVPLLLRRDIYALACVAGGIVYFIFRHLGFSIDVITPLTASVVIFIRIIAVRFHIHLPLLDPGKASTPDEK